MNSSSPRASRSSGSSAARMIRCSGTLAPTRSPEATTAPTLRVELRGTAMHDVALHRGGPVGRQRIHVGQRLLDNVGRQSDPVAGRDRVDLDQRPVQQAARLGLPANDANRRPRRARHAAQCRDEQKLAPHGGADVRGTLRHHATCAAERGPQCLGPVAGGSGQRPEGDVRLGARVPDTVPARAGSR